ncbi:Polysaccharide pyruvyl transferase family protein [Tenacibaculum sp. 190524A02b]|uniref:polysaccharide pyruvyl transferase family protein n=1 Tax=Tenacibaculum vairaonense TaxID=3137860 RepID=UPI0032B18A87
MKKIGILTQPLHDNYGGLLQAYALSEILKELGNNPIIINRRAGHSNFFRKIAFNIKQRIFPNKYTKYNLEKEERKVISKYTNGFRDKLIPNLTEEIIGTRKMRMLYKEGFSAYVVGSDQCWRPGYSPKITNYFLDFAESEDQIKRISYAASFGTSDWEFSPKQTKKCKRLLKKFDSVSVREDSGVDLCLKYFEKEAQHVLDPTMLFSRDFYDKIIENEGTRKSKGNLKAYVLDKTHAKYKVIEYIESKLNLKSFEVMPKKRLGKCKPENLLDYQFPSPFEWIRGFYDAKFVIADSFHGTVFAILYNKPFIAIGNQGRGMARFTSLLNMFGLEDRLVTDLSISNVNNILEKKINWNMVNKVIEIKRNESINFLKKSLQ